MKKEKKVYHEGDIIAVEFLPNKKDGRKPVCLIDGIVCFINRTYRGQFIEERSVWHVEIAQINEKSMVVDPVQEIKTAFENKREIDMRMKTLSDRFSKSHEKHVKPKVFYPYKSKQERET